MMYSGAFCALALVSAEEMLCTQVEDDRISKGIERNWRGIRNWAIWLT